MPVPRRGIEELERSSCSTGEYGSEDIESWCAMYAKTLIGTTSMSFPRRVPLTDEEAKRGITNANNIRQKRHDILSTITFHGKRQIQNPKWQMFVQMLSRYLQTEAMVRSRYAHRALSYSYSRQRWRHSCTWTG